MQFEYSSASELQRVLIDGKTAASFQYDAFGRLASKTVDHAETSYSWLVQSLLSESSATHRRNYLFLPTTMYCIALADSKNGVAFVCPDRTGAPVCIVSFDGRIVWQRSFRLFGTTPSDGPSSPISFLGQHRDSTGLDYNYARFYDAATGRYPPKIRWNSKPVPTSTRM